MVALADVLRRFAQHYLSAHGASVLPSHRALGLTQPHAILVVLPLPGSPAERAGLRPGDVILEFEGIPVGALSEQIAAVHRRGA